MSASNKIASDDIEEARRLGAAAFTRGATRAPCLDTAYCDGVLAKYKGDQYTKAVIALGSAWLCGFDRAMLAAPVE